MTYQAIYEEGVSALADAAIAEAKLDARLLLEAVCKTTLSDLHVHPDRELTDDEFSEYHRFLAMRAKRIPLQHILGVQDFMGLTFEVSEDVLIPRQDTEILVEEVLRYLHDGMSILDIGTGSGCILLSLLHYSNDCKGVGTDISPKALDLAVRNAEKLGIPAIFVETDLTQDVKGPFDIVVSNPPYIKSDVIPTLEPEVREYDPKLALDGGPDGLEVYKRLIPEAFNLLKPEGWLFLEIGHDQGKEITSLLAEHGFRGIEIIKDYAGLDRVVKGYKY